MNDLVNEKYEVLEYINVELKEVVGGDGIVVLKIELFKV